MKNKIVLIILISIFLLNSFYVFNSFFNTNLSLCYAGQANQIEKQIITMEEAKHIVERRFEKYGIKTIEYAGKQANDFNSYEFNLTLNNDQKFCVKVSARDGNLIKIDCVDDQMPIGTTKEECLEFTEEHMKKLGFKDLEVVWSTKVKDYTIVNLAPVNGNVVVYPDLIKARVNCKTGKLIDLEARSYSKEYSPQLEAEFLIPTIPYEDVKKKLREDFIILSYRLALILDNEGTERLVYEIRSQYQDFLYYIYIDAKTGEQVMTMPIVEE